MNGKRARAARRAARQREAGRVLSGLIGAPGLYVVAVDDDRDGDVVRITQHDGTPLGRIIFEDVDAADAEN